MHRGGKRAPPNHPLVRSLRCKPWVGDWQHSKVFHSCSIGYCKEVQQGFPLCIEIIETWVISIHWVQCRDVSHATDYRGLPPCLTLLLFLSSPQNNQRNINFPVLQLCVCLYVLGTDADNQNGNLRWHLPWRGGGRDRSRVPHTNFEKWFLLKII